MTKIIPIIDSNEDIVTLIDGVAMYRFEWHTHTQNIKKVNNYILQYFEFLLLYYFQCKITYIHLNTFNSEVGDEINK